MAPPPVLLWYRDDRRVSDHAALHAALETGRPVLPVYILDDAAPWAPGGAARWWLHHSLAALTRDLSARGAILILRQGNATAEISRLVAETQATDVFTGGSANPPDRQRDRAIAETSGATLHRLRTMTLFNPDSIRTKTGTPYGVYTPFANTCFALGDPRPPLPAPSHIPCPPPPRSDRLEDWDLLPTRPDWASGLRATWTPGEADARRRLDAFAAGALTGYAEGRDRPGIDGTSLLSPYLHHGELSAAQVWHAVRGLPSGPGQQTFLRELLWREFCVHLLWHHPDLPNQPLRPGFAAMPWRDESADLSAWQRGQTGVPIVDAGMRQLWQTGWMHNRVRMIVASFLVKHLLLPWQHGEKWFWDTLVDADLASNAGNWQWVAGCGADAAPWFRIFNPMLQGRKFDPDGAYVRRFVPELAQLAAKHLHAPWEAPALTLQAAGVRLGGTYPHPIVDLAHGRTRALAAFASVRADR